MSNMPPFQGKDCRLESWCACCLEPVHIVDNTFELKEQSHPDLRLHLSVSPWDWNNHDMRIMCDSMNYVIDPDHAERYERQLSRRGVSVPLDKAKQFVKRTGDLRMHDYHWPAGAMDPRGVIDLFRSPRLRHQRLDRGRDPRPLIRCRPTTAARTMAAMLASTSVSVVAPTS